MDCYINISRPQVKNSESGTKFGGFKSKSTIFKEMQTKPHF